MAFQSSDGKKFSNRPPMMQHNRSMAAKGGGGGLMGRSDPLQQPGQDGGGEEIDANDKPLHTEHHPDGGHTTVHESGAEKHTTTAEELVDHLKKHLPDEEQEIADDSEPEYE
jgi:hypothetical protein